MIQFPKPTLALFAVTAATIALVSSPATAQQRVGEQALSAGLTLAPGFFHDATANAVGLDDNSGIGGLRLRFGFHHRVSRPLAMAAEVELGQGWHAASRVAPDGFTDNDVHFAWQLGLMGRWIPRADGTGPALGFGLHTFRARLPEAPLQTLSGDLRLGWYLWQNERFVLAEVGYAIPFLSGLDLPNTFSEGVVVDNVDKNWTMHRFSLGFSVGF